MWGCNSLFYLLFGKYTSDSITVRFDPDRNRWIFSRNNPISSIYLVAYLAVEYYDVSGYFQIFIYERIIFKYS